MSKEYNKRIVYNSAFEGGSESGSERESARPYRPQGTFYRGIGQFIKSGLRRSRLGELLVLKGVISPQQLRHALKVQKENNEPLGRVLMSCRLISPYQLARILGQQWALRSVVACVLCVVSFTSMGSERATAGMIKDVPAQITMVNTQGAQQHKSMASFPGLFGTVEKRSRDLEAFTKWTGMFDRFDRELKMSRNKGLITQWQKNLRSAQGLPLKSMAARVNQIVNEKRYILDKDNWGKSDYWATPVEFLKRGGDCEDFAIAKYTALRMLGVPEERLRVAIVHDTKKNIPHAVLVVYTDEGSFVLDNQIKTLVKAKNKGRYRPIFSINRQAWWLHTAKGATILASR